MADTAPDLLDLLYPDNYDMSADVDMPSVETPYGVNPPPTPPSGDASSGSGEANLAYAYNYFLNQGFKPHQAAAIVGNLAQESGGNTGAKGGKILPGEAFSYGLAQHNKERLYGGKGYIGLIPFAQARGKSPDDLDTQLDHIMYELNGPEHGAMQSLMQSRNLEEATTNFGRAYERPSEKYANYANRIAQAQKYLGAASPEGAGGQQEQGYPEGSYEIVFPDGGKLAVYGPMSQQEAIAEAAKQHPELSKYLHNAPEQERPDIGPQIGRAHV